MSVRLDEEFERAREHIPGFISESWNEKNVQNYTNILQKLYITYSWGV